VAFEPGDGQNSFVFWMGRRLLMVVKIGRISVSARNRVGDGMNIK
jgi:hypothetical protein